LIPGFEVFTTRFDSTICSDEWQILQEDFNTSNRILLAGNGGNLAVCDHGAIDIARLTNKSASAPGSGILASSLINDVSHDCWVRNWIEISLRGLDQGHISNVLFVGVSSSGYSKNICLALDYAHGLGCRTALISARYPKLSGAYNKVILDVGEYHTSEVLTLALIYELIHSSGFSCPSIDSSVSSNDLIDYSRK